MLLNCLETARLRSFRFNCKALPLWKRDQQNIHSPGSRARLAGTPLLAAHQTAPTSAPSHPQS